MVFKLAFTPAANENYKNCLEYLIFKLKNEQAVNSLLLDIEETIENIRNNALSYALCDNEDLRRKNLRKIHLKRHSYKIFYNIIDDVIFIRAILHDKQDFENILK